MTFTFEDALFPVEKIGKRVRVALSGINGKSNLNRVTVVKVLSQTSCKTVQKTAWLPFIDGGKGRYGGDLFINPATVKPIKVGRRPAGPPLLVTPGRARARILG